VVVDGLQAGMLGPFGNRWIRTPAFNRLASDALVCDFAYNCRPSLNETLRTLLVNQPATDAAVLITDEPAAALCAAAHWSQVIEVPPAESATAESLDATQFAKLMNAAVEWLSQATPPFKLWIWSRGMYGPWDAPLELRQAYGDEDDPDPPDVVHPPALQLTTGYDPDELLGLVHAYAGQVAALDDCLGDLLDAMVELPDAENTLLAVLGARGYPLGEHLRVGLCDAALYSELTHVPLLVRLPNEGSRLLRTGALVSLDDVPESLANFLADVPLPLVQLGEGQPLPWRDHLLMASQADRAIRTPAWLLRSETSSPETLAAPCQLYVKPDDRWEVNDIADRCGEITEQLAAALDAPTTGEPLPHELVTPVE
jgi:hypothetical protein